MVPMSGTRQFGPGWVKAQDSDSASSAVPALIGCKRSCAMSRLTMWDIRDDRLFLFNPSVALVGGEAIVSAPVTLCIVREKGKSQLCNRTMNNMSNGKFTKLQSNLARKFNQW